MPPTRRPLVFLGAIVLALTGIILISQWRAGHAVDLIPWRKDLAAAEAEARAQHKQVFAYFTATWCGPCQEMKRTTWSDNTVRRAMERRFVPVKVDIDENRSLASAYGIEAVPTFIWLDDSGKALGQTSGYMDAKEMENWLEH
jgi:thiol:disulfide interchange protein